MAAFVVALVAAIVCLVTGAHAITPLPPGDVTVNFECNCCVWSVALLQYYYMQNSSVNLTDIADKMSVQQYDGADVPAIRLKYPCNELMIGMLFGNLRWRYPAENRTSNFTSQLSSLFEAGNYTTFDICATELQLCTPHTAPIQLTCAQCANITAAWNDDNLWPWFGVYPSANDYNYANDAPQWNVYDVCGFDNNPNVAKFNHLSFFNNDPTTCLLYFAAYFNDFWLWSWGFQGTRNTCPPTVPCT